MARALLAAFSLLTRLPLPADSLSRADRQRGLVFFPLVGAALGGVLALCAPALHGALGAALAGVLLAALLALLTGALHLDGLADFFDGLGGARGQRQRMLDIMRDPRIGAHGASALCLLLLAKAAAFAAASELSALHWILLPAVARGVTVPLVALLPPARSEGLAHDMAPAHGAGLAAAALLPLALAVALLAPQLWLACLVAALCALAIASISLRLLGGVTGDVYGALVELAETAAFIAVAARA